MSAVLAVVLPFKPAPLFVEVMSPAVKSVSGTLVGVPVDPMVSPFPMARLMLQTLRPVYEPIDEPGHLL